MTNVLNDTVTFFEKMKPNGTNADDFRVQLGCHFEEIGEMLDQLFVVYSSSNDSVPEFHQALVAVKHLAEGLKCGSYQPQVRNEVELMDALKDQVVTATGVGHFRGYDMVGALAEVNRANFSKFDDNGNPIFDANGKMTKGTNYVAPDLKPFLTRGL